MRGRLYGVGVGPGDPELMTLKAARLIREHEVIAVPGETAERSAAYRIAAGAVPEIAEKELAAVPMPMTRSRRELAEAHRRAAAVLESYLEAGRDVVYLTIGDPTVYCTFSYVQKILEEDGFQTELVSGVPSFCAAAARLNRPLTEGDEALHILPGSADLTPGGGEEGIGERLERLDGTCVIMKSGKSVGAVRDAVLASGRTACMVENCGLETERIFRSAEEIPDDAGYFSLIIAKEKKNGGSH